MRWFCCAAAALVLAWTVPAQAYTSLPLEGAGTAKCSRFITAFEDTTSNTNELVFFSWAEGYLSGFNESQLQTNHRGRDMSGMSVDDQQQFLHDYCQSHPNDDFASAVTNLYQTLRMATN